MSQTMEGSLYSAVNLFANFCLGDIIGHFLTFTCNQFCNDLKTYEFFYYCTVNAVYLEYIKRM